jgi:type I restriction enzyme S subunit
MEWKEVTISDIANLKNGKKRPSESGDVPVFGGNGIMDYVNSFNGEDTIVIGRVGAYCGCVYLSKGKCWVSDNAIAAKAKEDNDNEYLYYLLSSLNLNYHHIGGAQPLMTQDIIGRIEVIVPQTKDDQRRIASILSSLDRKIELNNKINADLEEMAQAIFKNWFVDFEPFKDGKFVDSELGMIPEGWKVSQIADIPHILETGKRPKGGAVEKGIPSVGAEHVKGMCAYDYSKTKYITPDFAAKLKTGKIEGYELMIYKDGGKPGYFIPNFSIFGEGYPFRECYLNEHVFKLDFNRDKGFNIFCYFFFKTDVIMSYFNSQGAKAAIPGINKKDVENIYILSPENEAVKEFGKFALPLFEQMLKNAVENRTLSLLRDTLLPRLMSGELEVPE